MVKQLELVWRFGVTPQRFFAHFLSTADFLGGLHKQCGDTNVDISEWIGSDTHSQRVCFYTKAQEGTTTKCIETQQYRINPDGTWSLLVHVNPESPLGGTAFAIDATWTARPSGDGGTEITITVTVELKRSLWGGYGNSMVEGLLEKSARTEYELWERTAQAAVATMAPPDAPSAGAAGADTVGAEGAASSADEVRLRLGPDVDAPSRQQQPPSLFNRHAIRYRVSTVGHGLVRGTERFVQAIAGAEEDLHEGGLIHVPINASNRSSLNGVSVFYHNGRYRAPRSCCQQRRRVIVLLVLLLLVAAVLGAIFWFFEELWVLLH